jgi:hypothetical protein
MSSTPQILPARGMFQPRYLLPNELTMFGLPDSNRQPVILSLVDAASTLIDQHCGRTDGTGQGSLVYSTYFERLLMQAINRNIVRLTFKPLVALSSSVINNLQASANYLPPNQQVPGKNIAGATQLLFTNYFWTGCQSSETSITGVPGSTVSPIIGCSGRYAYGRRGAQQVYDTNWGANLLMLAAYFGGPPMWQPVNLTLSDFDVSTGEIWVPAGLYLSQFTEIVVKYNSGFDPLNMPRPIKQATAMLVRNFLSRGGGTTGLRSLTTTGTANVSFTPDLVDSTIASMLDSFKTVMAY